MVNAAETFLKSIYETLGADTFFGVGGANIEDCFGAIERLRAQGLPLRAVLAKHEFGAASMADAFAKAGARPGVVLATSGAAALNLVPGLGESFTTRTPVLALIGEAPRASHGRGCFQDTSGLGGSFNLASVLAPITRYCTRLDSLENWPEVLERTVEALSGQGGSPVGPVAILIPKDLQQATFPEGLNLRLGRRFESRETLASIDSLLGSLQPWVDALNQRAQRVLLIAGEEVSRQGAGPLVTRLAEKWNARVAVTPGGKSSIPRSHRLYAGMCGAMGDDHVARVVSESSVCVAIGTPLSFMDQYGLGLDVALRSGSIQGFSIGSEPSFLGSSMTTIECRDLKATLRILDELVDRRVAPGEFRPQPQPEPEPVAAPEGPLTLPMIAPLVAPLLISSQARGGMTVIADAGNASAAVARDLELGAGAGFSMALGMGGMGYSIGAALGAALATRSPAIALAGDGAFFMHGLEIHSALEADAPVLFVIFNNNAHAMCVTRDQIYLGIEKSISRFKACPIAGGLSAMFPSLRTYEARTVSELRAAVESLQGFDRPSALVIELDADEIPPFLPFQDALSSARRA